METCANCGRTIGNLETPFIAREKIVCRECFSRLSSPPPTPPASVELVPCQACGVQIAKSCTKCPHCGKACGFDIGRCLVLFIFVIVLLYVLKACLQST